MNGRARAAGRLATALLALLLGGIPAGRGQAPPEIVEDDALTAVSADLQVEEALLQQDIIAHGRASARRRQHEERLAELRRQLDAAIRSPDTAPEELDNRIQSIERAEGERTGLVGAERELAGRVLERRRRIELITEQIAALQSRPRESGVLTGTWSLTMLPSEQRGTFHLKQIGTLVTGTYALDGGFDGSLEGTFIDRKVSLDRIDSKLGRMMRFEGWLSNDGSMLRGRWLNRELAGGAGANGQWSARRRERDRS